MKIAALHIANTISCSHIGMLAMLMLFTTSCSKNEMLSINEPVRLINVYYDYDNWEILPDYQNGLFNLRDLMLDNPTIVIELSSHTDVRGSVKYNQQLSQERADAVKSWLVKRGVPEHRIVSIGYGEKHIINKCIQGMTCTEEEHTFNRRTEFKIIEGPAEIEVSSKMIFNPNAN